MSNEFAGTAAPLSESGFDDAISALGIEPAALWSVLAVETRGFGFLADKRPKILFERHHFHRRTAGRFDASNPDISNASAGGYLGGAAEYSRLSRAIALNRKAALESASWGLGQIMGFNATPLRYLDVEEMVGDFVGGEDAQIDGVVRFVDNNGALKNAIAQKKWDTVAFYYNGANYAAQGYQIKLAQFYDLYSIAGHAPSLEVRAAQIRLTYLGYDPHGVDGMIGGGTRKAALAFQKAKGLNPTSDLDDATMEALTQSAGI